MTEQTAYWHGGKPGLRPGDVIEPQPLGTGAHLIDGCEICEARKRGEQLPTDNLDATKVYITTDRTYARIYAAGYPDGALYRVEPIGDMETSPDPVPSWGCASARVVSVYDPLVRMSAAEVRRAARRLEATR